MFFFIGKSSPSRRSPQGNKKPRKGIHSSLFINQSMNFYSFFYCDDHCIGCTPGDKAAFNGHLIRLFTTEFNRLPTTPMPS